MSVDFLYGISPPMYQTFPPYPGEFNTKSTFKSSRRLNNGINRQNINDLYVGMCLNRTRPRNYIPLDGSNLKSCLKMCLNSHINSQYHNTVAQNDMYEVQNNQQMPIENLNKNIKPKKVSFADAHGLKLTLVKYLTGSTNEPPEIDFLSDMIDRLTLSHSAKENKNVKSENILNVKFEQPVSDYMNFKMRLESNNVCVENVIVNSTEIKGTIKVKNIAYDKNVDLILTYDNWISKETVHATYVHSAYNAGSYDTFQFTINVPSNFQPSCQKVEFCVRYRVSGNEYWDNNESLNYIVCSKSYNPHKRSTPIAIKSPKRSVFSQDSIIPSTYSELPTPESNTWKDWECSRFY